MNKADLVARVARDAGLTKAGLILRALDGLLDQIARSLKKGEPVKLVDFGTFSSPSGGRGLATTRTPARPCGSPDAAGRASTQARG